MLEDLQNGTNLILDRYAFSGVAFSSAKVIFIPSHLNHLNISCLSSK